MDDFKEKMVQIITNDGKTLVVCYRLLIYIFSRLLPMLFSQGKLRGFDNNTNCILEGCVERVFSLQEEMNIIELGDIIIRGDSMFLFFSFVFFPIYTLQRIP